ncbi:MAG: hypothetical protein EXQ93_00005 [Alphaproteobacteria bacterium]|nr:hypothetical protein [Alphaproteobacteria bacterium]
MEITSVVIKGRQLIQSYGGGGFMVSGMRHRGAVLVFPDHTTAWPAANPDVSLEALAEVVAAATDIDLLLIGTGAAGTLVTPTLRRALKDVGIAVESMTTPAACRTFNVLAAEERRVAAALIAIE